MRLDEGGELWVQSPLLFGGYLDDPAATADCLVDGWYRTGDVADQDDEGYLRIVGRTGDLLRSGGESVLPLEVETVLAGHPSVTRWPSSASPTPSGGTWSAPWWWRPREGPLPPWSSCRALCAGRLAPFKHPRQMRVVDDLPRTAATGQVQRRLLAERLGGPARVCRTLFCVVKITVLWSGS